MQNKQLIVDKGQIEVTVEVIQRNICGVPQILAPIYTHCMPMFPQYLVVPMYPPNVIPLVPIYHPHNQSFPLYPQVYPICYPFHF